MAPATEKSAPHGSKRAVRAAGPGHLSAECPSAIHNDRPPVTEGLRSPAFSSEALRIIYEIIIGISGIIFLERNDTLAIFESPGRWEM